MRTLLAIGIVLLLLPVGAEARRERNVIVVRDYLPDGHHHSRRDAVVETVANFNAVMPKRGPRLRYEKMEETSCEELALRRVRKGEIKVCVFAVETDVWKNGQFWRRDAISIDFLIPSAPRDFLRRQTCHELMHALTGVKDDYGALPEDSCVHGWLPQPGPFDVELLRQTYGRKHR